ncbi:hypothetical protein CHU92_07465 [Flavobacterium cyanobacteriorum]|uniref:Beta-carotene 15,15'-monooxygenase n=1 Tax=Flavobacterium cyanobacteriorum TaxID=2022802 RepID=A0A255Z8E0_9FLAO|nr:hypothetical protein [Flavobacterium cyanobacteriorum]OYQ37823.1 hypothetical protein CHU92_07465 [Flavobacterium cyanobacteriorum]
MDELEKLKTDWKKNRDNFPRFSEKEIYAMLHRRSSSIVKWILIVSILEFTLWLGLSFLLKDAKSVKMIDSYGIDFITIPLTVISYAIIVYFVAKFYINYKKITTTDNVKTLMDNILKTRRTVMIYIYVNLAYIFISSFIIFLIIINYDSNFISLHKKSEANGNEAMFYIIYIISTIFFLAVFVGAIWLFYKLIYGLLLKRLHKNYEELKKIDL